MLPATYNRKLQEVSAQKTHDYIAIKQIFWSWDLSVLCFEDKNMKGPKALGRTVYRGHWLIEHNTEPQTLEEESTFICYK